MIRCKLYELLVEMLHPFINWHKLSSRDFLEIRRPNEVEMRIKLVVLNSFKSCHRTWLVFISRGDEASFTRPAMST